MHDSSVASEAAQQLVFAATLSLYAGLQKLTDMIIISEASQKCLAMVRARLSCTLPMVHTQSLHECALPGFVTKLSSAGLVYKHFGKSLVAAAMGQPADSPTVETTWLAVYKYFMEAVDGIDNGMLQSSLLKHCLLGKSMRHFVIM